ncbi:MAG: hypothetical protein RLZZ626_667 [Actinomycetota bacterium]|jgi:LysM repeat protein
MTQFNATNGYPQQVAYGARKATRPVARRPITASKGFKKARAAAILVALVWGGASIVSGQSATASNDHVAAHFTYVNVQAGDSLWSIAERVAPNENAQEWIARVATLNNLTDGDLVPGQRLALP